MIQRSFNQNYRAAALVCAAVVFSTVSAARVQAQALTNLFGGTQSSNAATAAVTVLGGNTTSGVVALGSGYNGTITLPVSVLATVSETVNAPATPNDYVLTATGVTLGATFNANKDFTTAGLQPSSTYALTFTSTNSGSVNLLGSAGFSLSLGGTTFANTSTGLGILGVANVLGVLNNGGTTTVQFTTPANITPASTVNIAFLGTLGTTVGLGNTTLVVSGASISQVPEPSTVATALIGMVGLAVWRARRSASVL